jgi:sulfite exporter TauE/SafE
MTLAAAVAVLGAGLLAGLASIPHCAAMCGPLAAHACAKSPGGAGRVSALSRWQLGRMVGYAALGAIAGGAGTLLVGAGASRWTAALVSWSCAAALVFAAVRVWPRASRAPSSVPQRFRPRAPGLGGRVLRTLAGSPGLFGAATAVLPCGALAAAVVLAASTTTAAGGALSMVAFAMGSAPGLLGLGWFAGALARMRSSVMPARVLASVLFVGAVVLVVRPLPALLWAAPVCQCH